VYDGAEPGYFLNGYPLWVYYPKGVDTFQIKEKEIYDSSFWEVLLQHNQYNRKIIYFEHQEGMAGRGG
jgi:hypothetical protein